MQTSTRGIRFLRWPVEADLRTECRQAGVPCLLVVEAGAQAPVCVNPSEDWIRAPAPRQDIEARVQALVERTYGLRKPEIDSTGVLHFGHESVAISNTQADLLEPFVAHYGEVVYRAELEQQVLKQSGDVTRNALDLQIMRLRRRIAAVGLGIRTVWGRGYILEPVSA